MPKMITLALPTSVSISKTSIPEPLIPAPAKTSDPAAAVPAPPPQEPVSPRSGPRAFEAPRLVATRRPRLQQQEAPEELRIDVANRATKPITTEPDVRLAPPPPPPKTVKLGNLTKPEFHEAADKPRGNVAASGFGSQALESAPQQGDRQSRELARAGFGSQQAAAVAPAKRNNAGETTGAFAPPAVTTTPAESVPAARTIRISRRARGVSPSSAGRRGAIRSRNDSGQDSVDANTCLYRRGPGTRPGRRGLIAGAIPRLGRIADFGNHSGLRPRPGRGRHGGGAPDPI